MFSTPITRTFRLTTPIVNAGMAMIARPALAAAVCEAGGLGTIGSDINPPDVLRDLVRQTKTLTKRPFGVDLIGDFVTDDHVSVLIEEQVALAIFFWTLPTLGHVDRLKQAGIQVGRKSVASPKPSRRSHWGPTPSSSRVRRPVGTIGLKPRP